MLAGFISALLLIVSMISCSSKGETEACVDHPPFAIFQNKKTKECITVTAPSCVSGDKGEDLDKLRNKKLQEKSAKYQTSEYSEIDSEDKSTCKAD